MARQPKPYVFRDFYCTSAGGVQHQKLCPFSDGPAQAKIALARLLIAQDEVRKKAGKEGLGNGIHVRDPGAITLDLALEEYLHYRQGELLDRPQAFLEYKSHLRPFFAFFKPRHPLRLRDLTSKDGTDYKKHLLHDYTFKRGRGQGARPCKGVAATTARHYLKAVRAFFRWCQHRGRGYLDHNPWEEIKMPKARRRERVITDAEFDVLLAHCTHGNVRGAVQDFQEMLIYLRHTGCRPGELRKLRWEFIDWVRQRIVLPGKVVKTGTDRHITILPPVEAVLHARHERLGLPPQGPVWPGIGKDVNGRRARVDMNGQVRMVSFSTRFRRLVDRCVNKGLIEPEKNGERLVLYSNRHTRITEAMTVQGLHPVAAMQEFGHTRIQTTMRYTHPNTDHLHDQVRAAATRKKL